MLNLKASDGHGLSAYRADPTGRARGAIVVIQEIFGVNSHIRSIVDGYAAEGYTAIAPALFDRVERNVELGYSPNDMQTGIGIRSKVTLDQALADTAAAVAAVASVGKVGVTGYCFGGSVAHAAGTRLNGVSAAVGYYGGGWKDLLGESAKCPIMMHFAEKDGHIPIALADEFKAKHGAFAIHKYAADHGFSCDQRGSYEPYSHYLARGRTLAFFAATLD
jgi:carboxymethylenebutenolidase